MLKKLGFIIILVILVGAILGVGTTLTKKQDERKDEPTTTYVHVSPSVAPTAKPIQTSLSIFVPYWSCDQLQTQDLDTYDRVFYFGITPTTDGINFLEDGYKNLAVCSSYLSSRKSYLTVRMINADMNDQVLTNTKTQDAVIKDTIDTATKYGFKGVALDLEFGSNFLSNKNTDIKSFVQKFHKALQQSHLPLTYIVYGDNFYRPGGLDISTIKNDVDEVMIMAYDFHKANGLPGPNFPLKGKEKYGYDMETMVSDFLQIFPPEKISVIFGMYGYDWLVDEGKRPIRQAKSVTLQEVHKSFIDSCEWKNCVTKIDPLSLETEVDYIDKADGYHIIWFESFDSAKQKEEYLKKQGIGSFAYWAYGYF